MFNVDSPGPNEVVLDLNSAYKESSHEMGFGLFMLITFK